MDEALELMRGMKGLRAQIPLKETTQKQALDFSSPNFLEMLRTGEVGNMITQETAMRISAVYACNKVLAETIKTLPCNLYRYRDGSKEWLSAHSLQRLLGDAPNDYMTASEWWEWNVTNLNLDGNSYSYIVRDKERPSGKILALLPIPNKQVAPRIQGGRLIAYDVTIGDGVSEKAFTYQPWQILHFRGMTLDGLTGLSPIKYNSAMLEQAANARDFAGRVFTNGATPRGILTTEGVLGDEAYANIKESWSEAHAGIANSSKVAILEGGLKFEKISMSPEDVQLLDTRKLSRAEIAGIFRVPPHMIADLERSTFNNIEHQTLDFYKSSISPWLRNFEQRLNLALTPGDRNLRFRFDVREFVRGDLKTEVEAYGRLIELGVLNPNEVRERLDYNPREGGDDYIESSNNLNFGKDGQQETPDNDSTD